MNGEFKPYVPDKTDLKEFTLMPLVLGVVMTVVLGAAAVRRTSRASRQPEH